MFPIIAEMFSYLAVCMRKYDNFRMDFYSGGEKKIKPLRFEMIVGEKRLMLLK